jgi:hypothetical protein
MTTTLTNNGSPRRTLSSQLDRLDAILDALADGLNQAVGSAVETVVDRAVREAVQQALQQTVHGIMNELLTNPDALALLRATLAPEAPAPVPAPPPAVHSPAGATGLGGWLWARARQACDVAGQGASRAAWAVKEALRAAGPYRKPLAIAAGVGTAVALGACLAGPWVAGPAAWLGGFVSTLAVRAGAALRQSLGLEASVA